MQYRRILDRLADSRTELLSELHEIFKTVMHSYVAKSEDKCCSCDPDTAFLQLNVVESVEMGCSYS